MTELSVCVLGGAGGAGGGVGQGEERARKNQFPYLKKKDWPQTLKKKKNTAGGTKAIFTKSLGKENINQECSVWTSYQV